MLRLLACGSLLLVTLMPIVPRVLYRKEVKSSSQLNLLVLFAAEFSNLNLS